jgi:hypothetical protein
MKETGQSVKKLMYDWFDEGYFLDILSWYGCWPKCGETLDDGGIYSILYLISKYYTCWPINYDSLNYISPFKSDGWRSISGWPVVIDGHNPNFNYPLWCGVTLAGATYTVNVHIITTDGVNIDIGNLTDITQF